MPFWGGYWGAPWGGFSWLIPLIGLAIMLVMVFACLRMMGGMRGFGCMGGHGSHSGGDVETLRREVQELKEEIRKLRERS